MSGIRFDNINGFGLGACLFNSSTLPSLYQNNMALVQNVPESTVFWSANFSVHGILPARANQMGVDILYTWGVTQDFTQTSGTVTLNGFDSNGLLIGSASTPTLGGFGLQTHLDASFPSAISSFTIVANGLSTDYDNITFDTVPEPSTIALAVTAPILLLRRRTSSK